MPTPTYTGGPATLTGGNVRGFTPAYGGVPSVPSPGATQSGAVNMNLGNLGGLYNLASSTNAFNIGQAPQNLNANLPGYQQTLHQLASNAGQQAQGLIPQDVVNLEAQQAAERGISTGLGSGSPNTNAALLAALGKTSIGQQQLGQENFGKLVGLTPQAPMFDPSKFFVTPEQNQAAQTAANVYASAPNPFAAADEARKQALAAARAGGGGLTVGGGLPAGSPFHATNWGAPSSVSPTTWGGATGGGATPGGAGGVFNVTGNTVGGGPGSLGSGGGSTYMGSLGGGGGGFFGQGSPLGGGLLPDYTNPFGVGNTGQPSNPMYADEYFGTQPTATGAGPATGSVSGGWSPGGALPGTETTGGGVGDLFSQISPEDFGLYL